MENTAWLEQWYLRQCNGEWEHTQGISIGTLDNPGWTIDIDLNGTRFKEVQQVELKQDYEHEIDWIVCKIEGGVFKGRGGPRSLGQMIQVFRTWIEAY